MKRQHRLGAFLLVLCLLLGGFPFRACAEPYEIKEPYMKGAVRKSLLQTMGWSALFQGKAFLRRGIPLKRRFSIWI